MLPDLVIISHSEQYVIVSVMDWVIVTSGKVVQSSEVIVVTLYAAGETNAVVLVTLTVLPALELDEDAEEDADEDVDEDVDKDDDAEPVVVVVVVYATGVVCAIANPVATSTAVIECFIVMMRVKSQECVEVTGRFVEREDV